LALAIVCLLTAGNALAQNTGQNQSSSGSPVPSSIQIFLPNGGQPANAIRLTLVRDNGQILVVFTDSKGRYPIQTPRNETAVYTVTIETDRLTYATTKATVRLDRATPGQAIIFLNPITTERSAPGVLDVSNYEDNVPGKARNAYKRAMDSAGAGQFEKAISGFKEAIGLYPQYVKAFNDLGVVYMKLERLDEAADAFKKAIDIDKRFFHPRMNLGIVLRRQGKYKEAVEILEPLFNENKGMLEVRLGYGKALEGVGELDEADKIYRSTLESKGLVPAVRADLLVRLGGILSRQGRFAEGAGDFEEALALEDTAKTRFQLGAALIQLKDLERAEKELLRAYELGGAAAGGAQLLLGQIYCNERRFAEAQKAFEQYLKDVPTAPNAPQVYKLIADLKASKN
jgi:tetratricopeptide (TPR) repeat protein